MGIADRRVFVDRDRKYIYNVGESFIKNGREDQLCEPVPTCILCKVVLLIAIKG